MYCYYSMCGLWVSGESKLEGRHTQICMELTSFYHCKHISQTVEFRLVIIKLEVLSSGNHFTCGWSDMLVIFVLCFISTRLVQADDSSEAMERGGEEGGWGMGLFCMYCERQSGETLRHECWKPFVFLCSSWNLIQWSWRPFSVRHTPPPPPLPSCVFFSWQ